MSHYLIGVDIGTQGTKTALFSVDGTCHALAFRASKLHGAGQGRVEEDPEDQVKSVFATIRQCLSKSGIDNRFIAGVSVAGQMAGIIGIDTDGRAVTPYDSWLDTRCAPQIEQMRKRAGVEIISKTGGPASFNHGPKILWWKKNRPKIYRSVRAFVQPSAYVAMRLCGLDAVAAFIDRTYLHFSGFANNAHGAWDAGLCRTFAVDPAKLPGIVASHSVVGEVATAGASASGLRRGTPVVAGCGDTAASFLSCGATRENVCIDVAGTASVFAATTRHFLPDIKSGTLSCGQSAVPGLWHPYAYINGGGMNLEWFKDSIARLSLENLDSQASKLRPADDDPFFIPHLAGRVSPAWPLLRGSWAGLNWSHGTAHLYRAVLEGVALEYAIYRDVLKSLDRKFAMVEIRVTGGGERSKVWNRIKASVIGCPVIQMARTEGAPMGAALLAGFGVGLFKDIDRAAHKWIKRGTVTQPDLNETGCYSKRLKRYRELLDQLNHWTIQ